MILTRRSHSNILLLMRAYQQLYDTEERHGKIFAVFASLAIFIACLGLIGLASFTAERRKKEVGIRKVLGASHGNVIFLMTKEFTNLVLVAFIVASPFAWYIMRGWLQEFAYQVQMGVGIFLAAGFITLIVAWLTVAYQTAKTTLTNPVKALRYE